MSSSDLNRLVKEVNLLKMTAEMLEGADSNTPALCHKAMVQVEQMKEGLKSLRTLLDRQKHQIYMCKELLATVHHIENVTEYMEKNLPSRYFYSTNDGAAHEEGAEEKIRHLAPTTESWNHISPDYSASSSRKRVAQSPRPYIVYVRLEEFDKIPKYMKGRLTYEMVNKFIEAFNTALQKKYQLFCRPRNTLKGKKVVEYDTFKKQETKETIEKGIYFCVDEDLKTLGNIKMDKLSYNMLNILRNTQRIKEIRSPGIIRYAVFY